MLLKISHKIVLCFALLVILTGTAAWLLFDKSLDDSLQQYSDSLGNSLVEQTAASVRELVLNNDLLGLNVVLTQLVSDENILNASVFDVDNRVLVTVGPRPGANTLALDAYSTPITLSEAVAGTVQIQLDGRQISESRRQAGMYFLGLLAASLVLAVTAALALGSHFRSALEPMTRALEDGDSGADFPDASEDEFGRLQQALSGYLERVREMEARIMETGLWQAESDASREAGRQTASLLVVKVENINTAIELLHPNTLSNLLRECRFYLAQAARLYGGALNRATGDSILVSFDYASCGDEHSVNAVNCARLFQILMLRINDRHRAEGDQSLEYRLAIHSGDIFLAPGDPADRDGGKEETAAVLGRAVDIAYFLCNQTWPGELLASEATYTDIGELEEAGPEARREFFMPLDNMALQAYALTGTLPGDSPLYKQCRHILEEDLD